MTFNINDLINETLDQKTSLSTILRKSNILVQEFDIKNQTKWLQAELNGYGPKDKLPSYRMVQGRIMAEDPYTSEHREIIFQSSKDHEYFSKKPYGTSIPYIESLISDGHSNSLYKLDIPHEMAINFQNKFNLNEFPFFVVQYSEFFNITTIVRTQLTEWLISLKKSGNFNINAAIDSKPIESTPVTINNYGTISNSQFQTNTIDSSQIINNSHEDLKLLISEVEQLSKLIIDKAEKEILDLSIVALKDEINKEKPIVATLSTIFKSIKSSLEKNIGTTIASAIFQKSIEIISSIT